MKRIIALILSVCLFALCFCGCTKIPEKPKYEDATLKPADTECLRVISGEGPFFTMEEHALHGGFGSFVTDVCRAEKLPLPAECIGIGDAFISHGNHECLLKEAGLLPAQKA